MKHLFWRIRHLPTGLHYQPVKGYKKNSLSKGGKVYHKKPTLEHINHGYHRLIDGESEFLKFVREEWKVICYEVVEVKE